MNPPIKPPKVYKNTESAGDCVAHSANQLHLSSAVSKPISSANFAVSSYCTMSVPSSVLTCLLMMYFQGLVVSGLFCFYLLDTYFSPLVPSLYKTLHTRKVACPACPACQRS